MFVCITAKELKAVCLLAVLFVCLPSDKRADVFEHMVIKRVYEKGAEEKKEKQGRRVKTVRQWKVTETGRV